MSNLLPRGKKGIIYAVKDIPRDVRHAFEGKAQVWKSTGTNDHYEAARIAEPILRDIEARIKAARENASPKLAVSETAGVPLFSPDATFAAIQAWRRASIEAAYHDEFNGISPEISPFGEEAMAASRLRHGLQQAKPWGEIADFDDRMIAALRAHDIRFAPDHPALKRITIRKWFADAWRDVEEYRLRFQREEWSCWPEDDAEPATPAPAVRSAPATSNEIIRLSDLVERFCRSKAPKQEADIRHGFKRLTGWLGDRPVSEVTPEAMDGFLVALRQFPKTRAKEVEELSFREVLTKFAGKDVPRLAPKTVWESFVRLKRVFDYAVAMEWISRNPVTQAMPKKPGDDERNEVRAYTPDEIAMMFGKPLFQGFSGDGARGYRKEPGPTLVRDAKFWLPIVALWHGCRLEEIGGTKLTEIKTVDGVRHFDWLKRPLKTEAASRLLPIHPKMEEIGFVTYVEERRAAGDSYLFRELPHAAEADANDPEAATRQFTKWWGLWSDANGFGDPRVNFHSFRHTFKRQCRGVIDEELHDLLTGHKGQGSVGRSYGGGAFLHRLEEALAKIDFPTFPNLT